MKNILKFAIILSAMSFSSASQAAVQCPFYVTNIILNPTGQMIATLNNGAVSKGYSFCSLTGYINYNDGVDAAGTITADFCKTIYATLVTAKATAKPIVLYFWAATDCDASLPVSWSGYVNPYPYGIVLSN